MTARARQRRPQYPAVMLLACLMAVGTDLCTAAQAPADDTGVADLRADCRLEGEAGGLSGSELEQFIEACVADLQSVELSNSAE